MTLYLVQHAEAKAKEENPERPVSDDGLVALRKITSFIDTQRGVEAGTIYHSGKLRARQTAEVLAESVRSRHGVREADGLAPMDDPSIWSERLRAMTEDVMVVGHLPHLARLASLLVAGDAEAHVLRFFNAGIVCLERDIDGYWAVSWAVVPHILR